MKEKREDNNINDINDDEDNEKLTSIKFESFNVSLPEKENEFQIPKQRQKGIFYLIIIILIIIIVTIFVLISNKKENICQKGFFIPSDSLDNKCIKCSVENCDICQGNMLSNICTSCKPYLTPIIEKNIIKYCIYSCETGLKEKCRACDEIKNECSSCNTGYLLQNGKCILNYSFKAKYLTEYKNQNIKILNNYHQNIIQMIIDDKIFPVPTKNYTFASPGNHTIYFLLNINNISTLNSLFKDCTNLISLSFTELFDTSHVKNMSEMFFYCTGLTSLDISKLNTKEVLDMSKMFSSCLKLSSIDLSNFDTSKVTSMNELFKLNKILSNLNLNNFNTHNVFDMSYMFYGCEKLNYL